MDLESLIKKFRDDVEEEVLPDMLLEFIQQVENFFSAPGINTNKLDSYLGLVFPNTQSEGIYGFLHRKLATDKKFDKVKEHSFNLIRFILVQHAWKKDVDRFCLTFKNIADMYWKHKKESARVQQAALDCLISLFENFGSRLESPEDFDLSILFFALLSSSEKSSFQPTVRGKMFHLMGTIAALVGSGGRSFMDDGRFRQLFSHLISTLSSQVESRDSHYEASILHGCLKGLGRLLSVFGNAISIDDPDWIRLQDHLERIVNPSLSIARARGEDSGQAKVKRREFQRAALELVIDQGELLKRSLLKAYKQWFEDLLAWSKSTNADDNKVGRKAMNKFLDIVIRYSKEVQNGEGTSTSSTTNFPAFFAFFMERFKTVMTTKDANRIELSIAVRGYGMLADLCAEHSQSLDMLALMMEHVNKIIQELENTKVDKYSAVLSFLPTYLESVASILSALEGCEDLANLQDEYLDSIRKLTIAIIRFFPDLSESQRNYCHISVQRIFDALWFHHHTLCEPFMEQVYQQSFLHIVSSPTRAEIDILIESWKKSNPDSKKSAWTQLGLRPISSYVKLWKLLLNRAHNDCDTIKFDLVMKWVLGTISKLDLTINFDEPESEGTSVDPMQGATANVAKDFQIFVNIVDFFQELMAHEKSLHRQFERWISVFAVEMLTYIKSNACVSGFYKILAIAFDASRTTKYFENEDCTRYELQKQLNIFFKDLGSKIREYRDDLLFAVLELWLSLPDTLILTNFVALNQTLQTVFITGRNCFSLAMRGLEAIERWFFQPAFPVDQIKIIMDSIFPILKTYFMYSEDSPNLSKRKKSEGKEKGLRELIKKNVQHTRQIEDATLRSTQLKILQLLGSFGQYLDIGDQRHTELYKDKRFLRYAIPFQDCKPDFFIDDLLPRVLELCENSVERQTRISACEFLHSICLLFIGETSGQNCKESLFKQLFMAMLRLGCDSDITVRQLFNPLALQTIHWFTKCNSPYASIMLGSLTEALAQHVDLSLREFAALCMGQYFEWSLKYRVLRNGTEQGVLKTIFHMSTHSSPDYRQGSVLAFNSIYREFREEKDLTNEFTFNLIYSFLTSLKLSKDIPEDSLLIRSTKKAILHLERILIKMKGFFNASLEARQFKPFKASEHGQRQYPMLQDLVDWMLTQAGSKVTVYREECLRLIRVLSIYVDAYRTTERCLLTWEEKQGLEGWVTIAEESYNSSADQISYLGAASSFYSFLYENDVWNRQIFTSSRSHFWQVLLDTCSRSLEGSLDVTDEDKIHLVRIFSKLKFAWTFWKEDEEAKCKLWSCALKLSKDVCSLLNEKDLFALGEVITSGDISSSLATECSPLLLFTPIQDWSKVGDQISKNLSESVWHRIMAEQGLITKAASQVNLDQLKDQLWTSVNAALFRQLSTSTGPTWEGNVLSVNERKTLNNYLISALSTGLNQETVVEAAFDAANVLYKEGSFQLSTIKGRIFQKQMLNALVYCDSIFDFNILIREKPIVEVGGLIQRLLEFLKSGRMARKRFGEKILKKTVDNWKVISINCELATSLKIFIGLIAVDLNHCKNSQELSNWWNRQIKASHLNLKQKTSLFGYVNIFAASRSKKIIEALIESVAHFVQDIKSGEILWSEASQFVTYIFKKLLKTSEQLESPSQIKLLEPILSMVQKLSVWAKNDGDDVFFRVTKESLERMMKNLRVDGDQRNMATRLYELITGPNNKMYVDSTQVWKSCLLPAVSSMTLGATKLFFEKFINDIITKMGQKTTCLYDFYLKTLAVNLLELMIYQTNAEYIKGKELANAYWRNASAAELTKSANFTEDEKSRIVYKSIVRVCLNGIIPKDPNPTAATEEMRRATFSFNEACYNTLVAAMLVTNAEFKFCEKFLFPGKKIFESVVDQNMAYEFPVVLDEEVHKTGVISYRRRNAKEGSSGISGGNSSQDPYKDLLFNSQNLSGSSLAPEATSYDFTTSTTVADSEFYQQIYGTSVLNQGETGLEEIKLEWNEVNQHSCMCAFVEALKKMAEFRSNNPNDTPTWPTTLSTILKDRNVHRNVKIFIVGGIINTPESLEPFAQELTEPILQLILSDTFGSVKMNHFVQDVILTLLSWHRASNFVPEATTVTLLIKYILFSLSNDQIFSRRDVTKYILEMLQKIVKHWVRHIDTIPSQEILNPGSRNHKEEHVVLMLDVCFHVLLGGQLPQKNVNDVMRIFKRELNGKFKAGYTTAAKCIGLVLAKMKAEAPENVEEHVDAVKSKILYFKSKSSRFIDIISNIQTYFPSIMLSVSDTIFELCKQQKLRAELITLLPLLFQQRLSDTRSNPDFMDDGISPERKCGYEFFTEIDGRKFFENPCKTDEELNGGLDLLDLLIKNTTDKPRLCKMVKWVFQAEYSGNNELRHKFARCVHNLYREIMLETSLNDTQILDASARRDFLHIFIRLFEDDDEGTREVAKMFWAEVLQEWAQTSDILLEILDVLGLQKNPLNVCLGLMLQRCSSSPDYRSPIFSRPLEERQFYRFELDTSWRFRNASFQPLFAESLSSVKNFGTLPRPLQSTLLSQRRSVGQFGMNVLRATLQELKFTPTLERPNGGSATIDGTLLNERVDEYHRMQLMSQSLPLPSDIDDLMSIDAEPNNANSEASESQERNVSIVSAASTQTNPILKLRRKFYTRKDSTFFATRTVETRTEAREESREIEKARVSGVKTVRSYRIGEIPDIQIEHADIIKTLLKLATLDHNIGLQFLFHLYGGLLQKMDHVRSRQYLQKSKETFERVLRNSASFLDPTLSTLLIELCIQHKMSVPHLLTLDVCKITNSPKLAILKLEDDLCNEVEASGSSSKRSKQSSRAKPDEEEIWLGVAEMYKEIEEFDVLRNIFVNAHETINISELGKKLYEKIGEALHAEGCGKLEDALKLFEEAYAIQSENEEETSVASSMFVEDSMMQCLMKLGSWSQLYEKTKDFSGSMLTDDLIRDNNVVQRIMPMRMVAGMRLNFRLEAEIEGRSQRNLMDFNNLLTNYLFKEEGTAFFTENYPFDLAMWLLVNNEDQCYVDAGLKVEAGLEDTLRRMRHIGRIPVKEQRHIITGLQQATAIENYMKWKKRTGQENNNLMGDATTKLAGMWRKHLSFHPLDLLGNDFVAAHRDYLASKVELFMHERNSQSEELMKDFRVDQELWLTDMGIQGKNCAVAQCSLFRLKNSPMEELKPVVFRKAMAKFLAAFSKVLSREFYTKGWCLVWKKICKCAENSEISNIKADLLISLIDVVQSYEVQFGEATVRNWTDPFIRALNKQDSSSLSSSVLTSTLDLMRTCDSGDTSSNNPTLFTKLFHLLKKVEDDLTNTLPVNELAEKMMCCVLRGCTEGSASDMLMLSNVFSLLKKCPDTLNPIFETMSNFVPSYMFLPWIDQIMTAFRSSPEVYPSFKPLIDRLASEFPQSFQLQYPEYLNESYQQFAKAMKALVIPSKMHESHFYRILGCKDGKSILDRLVSYQGFLQGVLNFPNIYGEMHKEYASKMFDVVNKYADLNQSQQLSGDSPTTLNEGFVKQVRVDVMKVFNECLKQETDTLRRRGNVLNLSDLAPFLAQFHFFDFAPIEKPGLYESFKKTLIQEHPLIVSFHPTVKIFTSLTRPISFTLITNDGKKSDFLAKLGDDLRQDRRIQQLFKMSNVLFERDASIKQRNLTLETYSCIPVTEDFGIIEMVRNTMSMTDLIFDNEDLRNKRRELSSEYDKKWILKTCDAKLKAPGSSYNLRCRSSAKLGGRQLAEETFKELSSSFRRFTLRDNIRTRSKDLYEFFSVRQNMIKSYGSLCMVHWLLGIGDRHLENTLLSLTSGKFVGIDFGRAFGTSNYVIPLPELVPFRLTPQLQQLMLPYSYKGLFRESCILTWNCLLDAKEAILTVSDVFIQEPSMDWLKLRQGSKNVEDGDEENNLPESNGRPILKEDPFPFEIMKKKLLGWNPTNLLVEELKIHNIKDVPQIYCSIAKNNRIHLEKERLSIEEYVDVLLDLATDKNILIRVFKGWTAWV